MRIHRDALGIPEFTVWHCWTLLCLDKLLVVAECEERAEAVRRHQLDHALWWSVFA